MSSTTKVRILITTSNHADLINRTMESIFKQTFPEKDLYIDVVDFSSTDGTYEKLLTYDKYHLGIYRIEEKVRSERRIAYASKFLRFGGFSDITYFCTLSPGDTITPEFVEYCSDLLNSNIIYRPSMVMCETDIRKKNGHIVSQVPLFDQSFLLDGSSEMKYEYIVRGYQHRIICFGSPTDGRRRYDVHETNDRTNWNNRFYTNSNQNAIYVNQPRVCLQETEYEDVFSRLLSSYSILLSHIRFMEIQYEKQMNQQLLQKAYLNFAYNSLWTSFTQLQKGNRRNAEDCFLFSEVVVPEIVNTECYQLLEKYMKYCEEDIRKRLDNIFEEKTINAPTDAIIL